MKIGVLKEPGDESRVALIPAVLPALIKLGCEIVVEKGAGLAAGFTDAAYQEKGAGLGGHQDVLGADILARVRAAGALTEDPIAAQVKKGAIVLGFADPLSRPSALQPYATAGASLLAMEMIPRITRAQSMDALSSMATIAGYKAVLVAANQLPKMFPMMMTAAGTLSPARVFVIGAGVAGLQACATAKRLGAVVRAYDVRPAVKEQVQSVGAKFVELEVDAGESEDKGGYAKAMDEDFYRKQRELMLEVVRESDVVITTAAIPGKKSPVLVTEEMVKAMAPGSVIVDLAAERGGNCELTQADECTQVHGVTILGPTNLPGTAAYHASQMYSKNVTTLLQHLVKDGAIAWDLEDEITQGVLVVHDGQICHPRVKEILASGGAS